MAEHVETSLIIGRGQIGKSLYDFLKGMKAKVYIRDQKETKIPKIDILHIAFPYSENFVTQVQEYMEQYDPEFTIIYSTVPIGTTELLGEKVAHSPIEGRHPQLEASIELSVRWIGCDNKSTLADAVMFWKQYVGTIRTLNTSKATEFLKLRSTAKYGVNLVWADYEANVAKALDMDFEAIKQFDVDYNTLYDMLGMGRFQRYILDAPNGEIGGHCVVPNAYILDVQYPHDMLKMIKAMEKKEK